MSFTTQYSSPAVLGCGVFWHSYYRLGVTHLEERQSFLSKRVWEWPSHHLKTDSGQQSRDKKILLSPEGGGAPVLGACWRNTALMKISILTGTTHDFPVSFSTNRAVSASLKPLAVVLSGSQRSGSAPQPRGCWPAGWYLSTNCSLSNILSPCFHIPFFPLFPKIMFTRAHPHTDRFSVIVSVEVTFVSWWKMNLPVDEHL